MPKVMLSLDEIGIIQNMINFVDSQNCGADELLDCDYDKYNNLSYKMMCVIDGD